MVRVASRGKFHVYVYDETGQPHNLAHCDVRWADGDTQVALPSLEIIVGDPLPALAWQLLRDELEGICAKWDELNPGRPIR